VDLFEYGDIVFHFVMETHIPMHPVVKALLSYWSWNGKRLNF